MAAYRRGAADLHAALQYELQDAAGGREVAAEPIWSTSRITRPQVGLMVRHTAVRRVYDGDVWTETDEIGALRRSRPATAGQAAGHRRRGSVAGEAICRPEYSGIIIRRPAEMSKKARLTVEWWARESGLPIYEMDRRGRIRRYSMP